MDDKMKHIEDMLDNFYEKSIKNIQKDLNEIEVTINTDLLQEVRDMKESKELIKSEHGQMSNAFSTFKESFTNNWDQITEQLKVLDSMKSDKFKELVP